MTNIVDSVQRVSDIIARISEAAATEMLRDQAWPLDAVVQHFTLADASDSARAHNGGGADAGSAAAAQSDWKLIAKAS